MAYSRIQIQLQSQVCTTLPPPLADMNTDTVYYLSKSFFFFFFFFFFPQQKPAPYRGAGV